MSRSALVLAIAAIAVFGTGCMQNQGLYEWGKYEDHMLAVYENPENERQFATTLKEMIEESRAAGMPAPPGVAAEYGYYNYENGFKEAAIKYFDMERQSWPESAGLMTTLIARIEEEIAEDAGKIGVEPTEASPTDPEAAEVEDAAPTVEEDAPAASDDAGSGDGANGGSTS